MRWRGGARRAARRLVGGAARAATPAVVPVARRTRQYFTATAVAEVRSQLAADLKHVEYLTARVEDRLSQVLVNQCSVLDERFAARADQHTAAVLERIERLTSHVELLVRRTAVPVGDGAILIRTSVGYVLVDAADEATVAVLVDGADLETGVRLLLQRFLKPGDTFVDGGANIGLHTLAACRAMQADGRVLAFEPFPRTADLLRRTLSLNGFAPMVTVHELALSDRDGAGQLHVGAASGLHSLYPLGGSDASVAVSCARYDEVVPAEEGMSLVKLDVEGAEVEALNGMTDAVRRNEDVALIVEFGPSHLGRANQDLESWMSAFSTLGFEHQLIDAQSGELRKVSDDELLASYSSNLFMARPGSKAWARLTSSGSARE
jgi:FkbM family methyltransferase